MGTYLARPATRKVREDMEGPSGLRAATASMQGWRVAQEDAHIALPCFDETKGLSLFGVFDGHCGGVVSRLVADWLPEKLAKSAAYRDGDYAAALNEAFRAVDTRLDSAQGRMSVKQEAAKVRATFVDSLKIDADCEAEGISVVEMLDELCADNPDGMGCTAVVALVEHLDGDISQPPVRLHVANCGDSRCVLWDDRGRAVPMSRDHKPRNREELERIRAAGGWVTADGRIEDNLNLSRALGDFAYKRTRRAAPPETQMISGVPEVRSRTLRPGDRYVLIGCDGVWETKRGSQATIDAVRRLLPAPGAKSPKLSKALAHFLDDNLAKDESTGLGMDNMTALLLEFPTLGEAQGRRSRGPSSKSAASDGEGPESLKRPAAAILPPMKRRSGKRKPRTEVDGVRKTIAKRPAGRSGRRSGSRSGTRRAAE